MSIDRLPDEEEDFDPSDLPATVTLGGLGGLPIALIQPRRKRGRPKLKNELDSIDSYRAWAIQGVVKLLRASGKQVPPQRTLVKIMRHLERSSPESERAFSMMTADSSLEQSISRGKLLLQINKDWSDGILDHDLPLQ